MPTELAAFITLLRYGSRSWREYIELIEDAGSAQRVLEREAEMTPFALDTSAAESEIETWQRSGFKVLTILDADYPANLHGVHDRPPFLFVAGELQPQDSRAIAVIGGRKASDRGFKQAVSISEELLGAGFTIVSGLAAGIDTAAHQTALAKAGRTIAVIGTGLRHSYPRQNAALQQRIASQGAVVSQFWPDAPPNRASFPLRNATTSGLSLGTIIVEASETSGTRIQARRALAHGRPVFLLDSLVKQVSWARRLAAAPGTYVIGDAREVIERIDRLTAPSLLAG